MQAKALKLFYSGGGMIHVGLQSALSDAVLAAPQKSGKEKVMLQLHNSGGMLPIILQLYC